MKKNSYVKSRYGGEYLITEQPQVGDRLLTVTRLNDRNCSVVQIPLDSIYWWSKNHRSLWQDTAGVSGIMQQVNPIVQPHNKQKKQELKSQLEVQVGGDHYHKRGIQPIEYIKSNNLDFNRGSVIKYVTRDKEKNKEQDIKKAIHFLQFVLEMDYNILSNIEYQGDAE